MSHAVVLPDKNFSEWLNAVRTYMDAFDRVAVVRSPAGNDLNRYRNVTAVQAPKVWFDDDALKHIQRAYPSVVRIDVIHATTPAALQGELQQRIKDKDRFGEKRNNPRHIYDRFVLEWMTDARPTSIVRPFSSMSDRNPDTHEGFDIQTYDGAAITAAAAGRVTRVVKENDGLNYGPYVQISSQHDGESYVVTYAGLEVISVALNQDVKTGQEIGKAAGDAVKIVVQNPPNGLTGYKLPNVVDPILMIYWQGLRVRPTVAALRLRDDPGTQGKIIGTVSNTDLLETQELHGRTLAKLGVDGQWLRIRRAGTNNAYAAAWFLEARGFNDPAEAIPGVNVPGMNIDPDHPRGSPDPALLKGMGWVRLKYNVSLNPNFPEGDSRRYGNTDVNFTFNRYLPILRKYEQAGIKVILIFTHQTFGEGQGYVWPQMHSGLWKSLTTKFADIVERSVTKLNDTGLVYAYQIWNEQDTKPQDARASVPIPPEDYAHLLTESIRAIRRVNRTVKIITGGHVLGPEEGANYARVTLNNMPPNVRPDGIAMHPYGRGPAGNPFSVFGTISHAITVYSRVMPGKPIWITEWGILDRQGDNSIEGQVSQYARGFLTDIKNGFPGQVATATWYAWADGMDNGYGVVRRDGAVRQNVLSALAT